MRDENAIRLPKENSSLKDFQLNINVGRHELIFQSKKTLAIELIIADATRLQTPNPFNAIIIATMVPHDVAITLRIVNDLNLSCFCNKLVCTIEKDDIINIKLYTLKISLN